MSNALKGIKTAVHVHVSSNFPMLYHPGLTNDHTSHSSSAYYCILSSASFRITAMPTLVGLVAWAVRLAVLAWAFYLAYDIRMYAIREYGRLIHEFDP